MYDASKYLQWTDLFIIHWISENRGIPSLHSNLRGWISINRIPSKGVGELHVMSSKMSDGFNQGDIRI